MLVGVAVWVAVDVAVGDFVTVGVTVGELVTLASNVPVGVKVGELVTLGFEVPVGVVRFVAPWVGELDGSAVFSNEPAKSGSGLAVFDGCAEATIVTVMPACTALGASSRPASLLGTSSTRGKGN